ncbi:hypothetical protein D3C87_86470 [compost metagenome]
MIRNALIAVYILVVLAISVVARATVLPPMGTDADESLIETLQQYNYKTHVGEIVSTGDGSLVLVIDQNNFLPLQSELDMTPFIGSKVMISGIELEHQLAPNLEIEIVDPLPGFSFGSKSVVFFVFGISEVR